MDCPQVTVSLIGIFALRRTGERQPLHVTGNTKRLLMLLAGHANRGLRREHVIEEIWPTRTPERGRSALNTAVSRLRAQLASYPGLSVEVIDDVVSLRVRAPASTDAIDLDEALAGVPTHERAVPLHAAQRIRLDTAAAACGGEFLEGCDDHWILPLRERYSALFLQAVTLLMQDAYLGGDFERALDLGRRILDRDPFREGIQRQVMELYVLNGQRARAIWQYQRLKDQLAAELDIAPMPETSALYESILCPDLGASPARLPSGPRADLFMR